MHDAINNYIILLKKSLSVATNREEMQRLERLLKAAREIRSRQLRETA